MLRYAAMAAKWHEPPRDALDTMVLGQADLPSLHSCKQLDYMPFDPIAKRTEGTIDEQMADGSIASFKITKGAPHVIAALCAGGERSEQVQQQCEEDVKSLGKRGIRALAVARKKLTGGVEGVWEMLGVLTFLDPPRPDTKETIDNARKYGASTSLGRFALFGVYCRSNNSHRDLILNRRRG